jgi:ABC-type multidrug transport system fused ATPase/permease subunit
MRNYLKEILLMLDVNNGKIAIFILCFAFLSILDLFGIGLIGYFIALISNPESSSVFFIDNAYIESYDINSLLIGASVLLLVVFFSKSIFGILVNKLIFNFASNEQIKLRSILMESYQALPYEEHLRRNSSEYINTIYELTQQYTNQALIPLLRTIGDIFIAVIIVIFLFLTNPDVLIILVALMIFAIVVYDRTFRNKANYYGKMANNASQHIFKSIKEGIEGIKEVRILGKEQYFLQAVKNNAKEHAYYYVRSQVLSMIPRYFSELLLVVFFTLLIFKSIFLGESIEGLLPVLGIFAAASLRLIPMVNLLSTTLINLRNSRHAVSSIYNDLITIKSSNSSYKNQKNQVNKDENEEFNSLVFDNVSFTYQGANNKSLNGVSFEIKKGEAIGIVGHSGAGKTTMVDILLGFLLPQQGRVLYNGNIFNLSSKKWVSQIGYLPQDIFLIDDTLFNNITLSSDGSKNNYYVDNVMKAIHYAKLSEFVENLPHGLETRLGERGVRLSGGQRQRIALARAFYHDKSILVMDEATSALDSNTEAEIIEEIYRLKGKRTIIVIAHRLNTLKYCDRIYELKNGNLINCHTYSELMKK